MIGYKGLDKNFCCREFQYEVGKTYHHDGELEICESGFHFCDNPLAVLEFYAPADSRFALVEAGGNIIRDEDHSHKFCTDRLTIKKELSLQELIEACENSQVHKGDRSAATNTGDRSAATNMGDFSAATNTGNCSTASNTGYRSVASNTGNCSAVTNTGYRSVASNTGKYSAVTSTGYFSVATNTGDFSAATNSGDRSAATNTGDFSAAVVTGEQSVAIVTGRSSKAKGAFGCWLVLSEFTGDVMTDLKAFKVDGVTVLPEVFYTLENGKPVPADD